jgi:hypothetical protein
MVSCHRERGDKYPDFAAKTDIEATFAFLETVPN